MPNNGLRRIAYCIILKKYLKMEGGVTQKEGVRPPFGL